MLTGENMPANNPQHPHISSRNYKLELNDRTAELLGKNFWKICEDFGFGTKEQKLLLGLKNDQMTRSHREKITIPQTWDVFRRVSLLLGIVKSLNVMYPRNPELVKTWMKLPRNVFKDKSAIEMICEEPLESMSRLFTVRRILDMYRNGVVNELT